MVRKDPLRFGPLAVVATVWVAVTALFPSDEPGSAAQVAAGGAAGITALGSDGAAGTGAGSTGGGAKSATAVAGSGASGGGAGVVSSTGGAAAGGSTDVAAVAANAASGKTRGGLDCSPGVRQIPVSAYAIQCQPAFTGDNGGATYRGVTGDTIRIVERTFPDTANSQAVAAVGEQAGAASEADQQMVFETFLKYFNDSYELYGRKIELVTYESQFGSATNEVQSKGREEACLDADVVANELQAFAVIGQRGGANTGPFSECAAQRGLMVLNGAAYFPETFYKAHHPFIWATTMECERISYQVAEYLHKRLAGKPARWAGDDALRSQERRFATYVPNNDEYQHCVDITERESDRMGDGDMRVSRYNYTLDVSRFPDEAARGIVQFKADGATTIVLACDPISIIFLTQSAAAQSYKPEWFLLGVALQDTDNLAQLYDQSVVDGSLFGMSQLGATTKLIGANSEAGRMFEHITGQTIPDGTAAGYFDLQHALNLLQAAGPNLTPDAIAAGAPTIMAGGAPDFALGYWSYADGPDGAPGVGDHTAVDDSREIYWTSKYVSEETGKAGTFIETYGGQRFRNGEWPAEDPPVYPEG